MKNIILLTITLFLGLSLVGCDSGSGSRSRNAGDAPKGTLNVLNQATFPLSVRLDGKEVLSLGTGECASLTQDQLLQVSLQEDGINADNWWNQTVCDNSKGTTGAATPQCVLTATSVYAENEDGDYALSAYQAPAKDSEEEAADFSKCKPVEVADENEEEEEES